MDLTSFDILLLLLVMGGGIGGAVNGAVRVVGPFALILALITLLYGYPQISAGFGTAPRIQSFLMLLLLAFVVLLLSGLVIRALQAAVQASGLGPINLLAGALLGCVAGAVGAGALIWWLQTKGGPHANVLLSGSTLAPALEEFFTTIVSFTLRFLPSVEIKPGEPWWRTLW